MAGDTRTMGSRRRWRTGATIAAALTLVGTGAALALQTASAATVDTNVSYVLVNRNSGKALDVYNLATTDGAAINQYARNDGAWQQWRFLDSGGGWYRLQSVHSGKVLDLPSTADGVQFVQNTDRNDARQQFRLADSAGGYVRLINRNSGKALEVWEWSTADGAMVSQYQDLDGTNQQWQLVALGAGAAGASPTRSSATARIRGCSYYNGFYYLATTTWNSTITMRRSTTLAGLATAADHVSSTWPAGPTAAATCGRRSSTCSTARTATAGTSTTPPGATSPTTTRPSGCTCSSAAGTDPMGPYHFKADLGNDLAAGRERPQGGQQLYLMGTYGDGAAEPVHPAAQQPVDAQRSPGPAQLPTLPWERQTGAVNEGPEPLYHNGKVMVVYSASACWGPDYKLGLLTLPAATR